MNILLINHYAGSPDMGMEFRPYYFAREWVKMGHNVSIIASDYSHLRRVNPKVNKDFQKEDVDGIDYYWVKTRQYGSNGVKRALTMFQFVSKLIRNAKRIVKTISPDVVICSSTYPLDTYVGQKIKRISKKDVKLVHEIHDMWPLTPIELGGMSRNNPFIKIMQFAEDSFCKNADTVVSLLPNAKEYLIEHGMHPDKYHVVTNGVVLEEWENPKPLDETLLEHFMNIKKDGLSICYCGSIHKSTALEYLIEAVISTKHTYLTLIGPGFDKADLEKKAEGAKERIKFFESIPKQCIPNVFQYIDVFFVGSLNYPLNRFGMCMNKAFDAMMGGKPILYAVNAPNNYIEEFNCGVSVDAEDICSIIMGIEKLRQLSDEERVKMGENGRNAAMAHFNYEKLAKKFINILEV